MNRILTLQQDHAAQITAAKSVLSKAQTENRSMTTEEVATFEGHEASAASILKTLEIEQRAATLTNIPSDKPSAAAHSTHVHDNHLDKPFASFGEQLLAIRQNALNPHIAPDARLLELNRRSTPLGASEQVPSDGGFLIAPDFGKEIITIAHDVGLVYNKTRKFPIAEGTNAVKLPGIDEQSRKNGSRWGGVLAYWQNEADALVPTKPKFRLIELVMKKLTGLMYTTDEMLQDAPSFAALAMQAFAEEFAFCMDAAVFNGSGAGEPQGFMNANALITIAKETGQASATLVFNNIVKMFYRLHARSRKNAVWLVNQDTEQQLLTMSLAVGTGGSSVVQGIAPTGPKFYIPGTDTVDGRARLFNLPVEVIEQASTLGTPGDITLVDLTQYYRIEREMQSAASMHVQFLTDQMVYRFIWRADAQPIWHTALTPYNGTNTQSPFIALATR